MLLWWCLLDRMPAKYPYYPVNPVCNMKPSTAKQPLQILVVCLHCCHYSWLRFGLSRIAFALIWLTKLYILDLEHIGWGVSMQLIPVIYHQWVKLNVAMVTTHLFDRMPAKFPYLSSEILFVSWSWALPTNHFKYSWLAYVVAIVLGWGLGWVQLLLLWSG